MVLANNYISGHILKWYPEKPGTKEVIVSQVQHGIVSVISDMFNPQHWYQKIK